MIKAVKPPVCNGKIWYIRRCLATRDYAVVMHFPYSKFAKFKNPLMKKKLFRSVNSLKFILLNSFIARSKFERLRKLIPKGN